LKFESKQLFRKNKNLIMTAIFSLVLVLSKMGVFWYSQNYELKAKNVHSVIVIKFLISFWVEMIILQLLKFDFNTIILIQSKFLKQAVFRIFQNTKLQNCWPFRRALLIITLIYFKNFNIMLQFYILKQCVSTWL